MADNTQNHRIVIVGSGGVGKSALTLRYISDEFAEEYNPTIEDSYRKEVVVEGERCVVDILDTAGQSEFEGIEEQWYREGEGFVCVYSLCEPGSLADVTVIREKVISARGEKENPPFLLVGNKVDLVDGRQVTREQGEERAKEWDAPYMETSAKTRENVEEMFLTMLKSIQSGKKNEARGSMLELRAQGSMLELRAQGSMLELRAPEATEVKKVKKSKSKCCMIL